MVADTDTYGRGGNDPALVFDDVDVADVAKKIATFAFLNSGQVSPPTQARRPSCTDFHQICLALKRIFVQDKIADKFLTALVKETEALKVIAIHHANLNKLMLTFITRSDLVPTQMSSSVQFRTPCNTNASKASSPISKKKIGKSLLAAKSQTAPATSSRRPLSTSLPLLRALLLRNPSVCQTPLSDL